MLYLMNIITSSLSCSSILHLLEGINQKIIQFITCPITLHVSLKLELRVFDTPCVHLCVSLAKELLYFIIHIIQINTNKCIFEIYYLQVCFLSFVATTLSRPVSFFKAICLFVIPPKQSVHPFIHHKPQFWTKDFLCSHHKSFLYVYALSDASNDPFFMFTLPLLLVTTPLKRSSSSFFFFDFWRTTLISYGH